MYVWELVSCRLRFNGWSVWHTSRTDTCGVSYTVHLERPGIACEANGPTLTEAYAVAARRAREYFETPQAAGTPHFSRMNVHAFV